MVQNKSAGIRAMQYMLPDDEIVIYKGNTQEIKAKGKICSAEYLPDQYKDMKVTLSEPLWCEIEAGDCLEVLRMPEIEVRNCYSKCMGGFRISSGKKVIIENCDFETAHFSVAFTGDMNYWFENTGVRDVTIRSCKFNDCGIPLVTDCGFRPTEKAPYYHQNIKFIGNTVISPRNHTVSLNNVNNFIYENNTVINEKPNSETVKLVSCDNTIVKL